MHPAVRHDLDDEDLYPSSDGKPMGETDYHVLCWVIYRSIGVKEYFLFDPEDVYLKPRLQGFRLKRGKYVRLKWTADGGLVSEELQAHMVPEGHMLRFINLKTGKPVLTRRELKQRTDDLEDALAKRPNNGK